MSSVFIVARKDGTVEKKVIFRDSMNSAASKVDRAISALGTTNVPPTENAPHISSTDASNAIEKP